MQDKIKKKKRVLLSIIRLNPWLCQWFSLWVINEPKLTSVYKQTSQRDHWWTVHLPQRTCRPMQSTATEVMSVLLYGAGTWTITQKDFHEIAENIPHEMPLWHLWGNQVGSDKKMSTSYVGSTKYLLKTNWSTSDSRGYNVWWEWIGRVSSASSCVADWRGKSDQGEEHHSDGLTLLRET